MTIEISRKRIDRNETLFYYGEIKALEDWGDLLDYLAELHRENSRMRFIITFDDKLQAVYTRDHSIDSDLWDHHANRHHDDSNNNDLKNNEMDEGGIVEEWRGFKGRLQILNASNISIDTIKERIIYSIDEIGLLLKVNRSPQNFVELPMQLYRAPISQSYQFFAIYPNGYFRSDLSPFENYTLARYLEEFFQYELISIGASYLGFMRSEPLTKRDATICINFLIQFYSIKYCDNLLNEWELLLTKQRYLILGYVETLDIYLL